MRACVQRVKQASVKVENAIVGKIDQGLLVFLGISVDDLAADVDWMVEKTCVLRIFAGDDDKMDRSLEDIRGQMLVVSQFTLQADCRKGRRPSFTHAADPEFATKLYQDFVAGVRARGLEVATGKFQTQMEVESINDGPVTMLLDSKKKF
ncbi:MAG: D-aminoacyl-tRNA deacylase [Pirellulaceae bacterium]|nr:D-aminoacyl-tRNA deacylase [Pirellulaceae bacterium]